MRLVHGECQVARAQLCELLRGSHPRDGQWRVHSGADDHVHVVGQVTQRVVDRRQRVVVGHGVEVVEHEDHGLPSAPQHGQQLVRCVLDRASRDLEPLQHRMSKPRHGPLDRGGDVGPHPHRIVVSGVEGHPCQCRLLRRAPGADRRRLAVPRGRLQQGEPRTRALLECSRDPRSFDHVRTETGRKDLRFDERRRNVPGRTCGYGNETLGLHRPNRRSARRPCHHPQGVRQSRRLLTDS